MDTYVCNLWVDFLKALCPYFIIPDFRKEKIVDPIICVMFTTSMIEKEKEQIEIKDISTEGLDAVLKFIYTNTINITRNNIHDILHAATLLQVEPVIRYVLVKVYLSSQ